MKKEIRDKWCKALRSGEFEQGQSALQNGHCYCCLGVLCITAKREGVEVVEVDGRIVGEDLREQLDVVHWSHLSFELHDELIDCNDYSGWSFAQIADYLDTLECEESS